MSWPTRCSVPMNTLFYNCIQQTPNYFDLEKQSPLSSSDYKSTNKSSQSIGDAKLPLFIRQQILDYFVRERIETTADLICELLNNGGVTNFDLWSLCEINNYSDNDVCKIIDQLTLNCDNLIELNIGGPEWIYNTQLTNGNLMNLFKDGNLMKLKSLKLQQANNEKMFYEILRSCSNLTKLEIREPSITDHHIAIVSKQLTELMKANKFKLQELTLPSSVRNDGLFDCFNCFTNLKSLSISNFEPVFDYLDELTDSLVNQEEEKEEEDVVSSINSSDYRNALINRLKQQLEQLEKLTIKKPMGQDSVNQIVRYCPNLVELNLEVQEIMHLKRICKLKSLKSLSLHNSPNLPTSFLTEVLPILEKIGHQFISLSLEQFDVLDLVEINKFCPELSSFSAQWFTLLSVGSASIRSFLGESINMFAMAAASLNSSDNTFVSKKSKEGNFSNLRLLRLRPRLNRDLSALAIEYLIRNAKQLQYLELYCCKQLNDALFNHWFELNGGFTKLKYLIVRHCNELNRANIARLLSKSSTNLTYLELDKPILRKEELLPNSDDPIDMRVVL